MEKTYLITGGAGFIGSHLVNKLLLNSKVICIDNFDPYYSVEIKEKNIKNHINNKNYKLYKTDITNINDLRSIFENNNITDIVHLAAKAGVRPSIQQPLEYNMTNVVGTVNLLETAKEFGIKKFIFGSSSSVYGIREQGTFREDTIINSPISPYAATKAAGEQICYTYSHLYGIKILCLRFFTVYGAGQRPDLAIHKFAGLINDEKPLTVYGDGTTMRDYTYIDDIIQGIISAIDYEDTPYEIINLGESRTVELNYLIDLLQERLKKKAIIKRHPLQPGDVPVTCADITKAKKLLGYNPTTPIEKGLDNFTQWFCNYYKLV